MCTVVEFVVASVTVCVQWPVWTVARAAFSPDVAETPTTAPSRSEYTSAAPYGEIHIDE